MNPPNFRFSRGRSRGGGAFRPYFYFKRNGRTIPAHGRAGLSRPSRGMGMTRRFSGRNMVNAPAGQVATFANPELLNSSFLRPVCYVAPENSVEITCINTDCPVQYPGWKLYFPTEAYKEDSEIVKRIKILEEYYNRNPIQYDLMSIQKCGWFKLATNNLMADKQTVEKWPSIMQDLQFKPELALSIFGLAMHTIVTAAAIDASLSQPVSNHRRYFPKFRRVRKIYARPESFLGVHIISWMTAENIDHLYCVRGYVDVIGSVETRFSWIAYKCARCGQEQALKQKGLHPIRPNNCLRSHCFVKSGFVEQRSSPYTKVSSVQIIRLVEFNSDIDPPASIEIELRNDLVDAVSPGQDIIVTGIVKLRPLVDEQQQLQCTNDISAGKSNNFPYIQAVFVENAERKNYQFSERDIEAIRIINSEPDSFKLLVQSLAPEIHGQELAKAGILLALFGGAGSQLHDENEISVLLVGDPGIGKSALLQMASKVSPNGTFTNGKRSSQQLAPTTHGRSKTAVHAGSLISASGGHCAVDDIDRLIAQQETLLQVMQTQTLCLCSSALFATLKTSTSVMATANSIRGHYDHSKLITENVRVHPWLLRQFHLVFVLLDKPNKDMDTSLTEHVKAVHAGAKKASVIASRYEQKPKANNSINSSDATNCDEHENYDLKKRLQAQISIGEDKEAEHDLLPSLLIKKFILYARQQVQPLLTKEAADSLKKFYMDLRHQSSSEKLSNFSTRQLEGLIRLAQARARIDFSAEVTELHVRDVLCIVRQSMADTTVGDYIDCNPGIYCNMGHGSSNSSSNNSKAKKFIQTLQLRSNALGRRVFDFNELKDIARRAGISSGVTNIIDIANLHGYLLKKGPNIYEVMDD